ncbi:MAG: hypothetical protein R2752_14055 [Vicinamibacterales bacterium]
MRRQTRVRAIAGTALVFTLALGRSIGADALSRPIGADALGRPIGADALSRPQGADSVGQTPANPAPDPLAGVRALYASAAYEEALAGLDTVEGDPRQIDQYRALCLLALGRTAEAERALERIVSRTPAYVMDASEVSPRLIAVFHTVRQRVLPTAVRGLYAEAKQHYDAGRFEQAATGFTEVQALLADADMAGAEANDLKLLTDGFLTLANAAVADAKKKAEAEAATPEPPAAVPGTTGPRIYTEADTDVKAPVPIERELPPLVPPPGVSPAQTYRGVLELLIDEQGRVQFAAVRQPIAPFYDQILLDAAKHWTFHPATQYDRPVPYRLFMAINLKLRGGGPASR